MDLRLRVHTQNEAKILEIGGEIDLHSAPQLRAALLSLNEAKPPRIVVDLSEVSFVDSTGIGVLVGGLKRAREAGGALHFCGAQFRVRRVFEITGLMGALPIFESRDAALSAFTPPDTPSEALPDTPSQTPSKSEEVLILDAEAVHDG